MPRDGSLVTTGSEWLEPFDRWAPKERRTHDRQPLILSGHGIGLRVNHGALEVRNGFTHHPQQREEWRFFPGDWRLPSRIVVLDGDGGITFDVLAWLSAQRIPFIQMNWLGEVIIMAGDTGYSADPKLVIAQQATQLDQRRILAISRWVVAEKISRSGATLSNAVEPNPARERALQEINASAEEMVARPPGTMDALRGIEGRVAQAYFRAWRTIPLRWKGIGRKPIPDDWHRVGSRASPKSETNRQATHPVNALLNYGYAVLETEVRMSVVAAGLDPTMGFMHAQHPGRAALVLDLMEPLRPAVDEIMLRLVAGETFTPADFRITTSGICRLHPQLARRIVCEVHESADLDPIFAALRKRLELAPAGGRSIPRSSHRPTSR